MSVSVKKIKIPGGSSAEQIEFIAALRDPLRLRRTPESGSYLSRNLGAAGPADTSWSDTDRWQRWLLTRSDDDEA